MGPRLQPRKAPAQHTFTRPQPLILYSDSQPSRLVPMIYKPQGYPGDIYNFQGAIAT